MKTLTTDLLVLGSGLAGLTVALSAAGRRVTLVTKTDDLPGGSSLYAQGGIAAALGADDQPERHASDTLAVGVGLNDTAMVRHLTREGPDAVHWLAAQGVPFDRTSTGDFSLGLEAAHTRRRVAHAAGDGSGRAIVRALAASVRQAPHVQVMTHTTVWDLSVADGRVTGALVHTPEGWAHIHAAAVVLATGGMGQLFARTTNPAESTGDGVAMALRAGATVADLEFVQFHPTALALDDATTLPLLTEALRGEGARLCDEAGHFFMADEHPLAELAPRDVVARAIWARVAAGQKVFLDATGIPDVERRFPTVAALVAQHGYRLGAQPIPVTPAAHYAMGGVWTDAHCRTSLPGLYACGETAATGVHGANRLASNSLLECVVFGRRVAAATAAESLRPSGRVAVPSLPKAAGEGADTRRRLQKLMFQGAGLVRTGTGLQTALMDVRRLAAMSHGQGGSVREQAELRNLFTLGPAVLEAALERTESRGAHSRADHPATDRAWQHRSLRVVDRQPQPRKVRP